MARAARISNNQKRKIKQMVAQAGQALSVGRRDICETVCGKIEALWPDSPDLANMRGVLASWAEEHEKAEEYFVQAFNAAPKRFEFCKNLATHYAHQNKYVDAARLYQHALNLEPSSLPVALGLARALSDLREFDKAHAVLEQARRRHPNDVDVLMALHFVYQRKDCVEEALAYANKVLARHPDHEDANYQKARLLRAGGELAAAEALARKILSLNPSHAGAGHMLASLKTFTPGNAEDIALLKNVYEHTDADSRDRELICFALGKVMEDLHEDAQAFTYFKEGNDVRHQSSRYDADTELAHLQGIMQYYTRDVFERNSGLTDETPIFILGMPRCGSTLVEQILAAHPDVSSRGEAETVEQSLAEMDTPEAPLTFERIMGFSPEQWAVLGRKTLERLRENPPDTPRITEKSLTGIRLVGAIHCALPRAKIIHVRRHPMDACWSIYKADMEGYLFDFAYNLGELGYYYRMYLRLMQHWREVLPEGVMYELDYEALVADQEGETRKLLDACGLPWDDSCLTFYKARNLVRTLSVAQVRKPISSGAIARWKRQEQNLAPLKKILGDDIAHWPPV